MKYKTHINTKIQLHGGDGYKSCIMYVWADKTQIWRYRNKSKQMQIQNEIYKQISINTGCGADI